MNKVPDIVYVLSASNYPGDVDNCDMYMGKRYEGPSDGPVDTVADGLHDAMMFYTEQAAEEYREQAPSKGWEIVPIDAKIIFKARLAA